jgi:hypothetical protein
MRYLPKMDIAQGHLIRQQLSHTPMSKKRTLPLFHFPLSFFVQEWDLSDLSEQMQSYGKRPAVSASVLMEDGEQRTKGELARSCRIES